MAMVAADESNSRVHVPVKNTFIHFDDEADGSLPARSPAKPGRSLSRWHSEPDASVVVQSRSIGHCCAMTTAAEHAEEEASSAPASSMSAASSNSRTAFGGEMPRIRREFAPLDERLGSSSSGEGDSGSTQWSTPEHTPRHAVEISRRPFSGASTPSEWSPRGQDLEQRPMEAEHFSLLTPSAAAAWADHSPTARPLTHIGLSPSSSRHSPPAVVHEVPRAAAATLSAPTASPVRTSSGACGSSPSQGGLNVFTFTLRLDDDVGLGIDVMPLPCNKALVIQGILPHGGIEAWNRQCLLGGTQRTRIVLPGDVILGINGKGESPSMLQECKEKMLLKMTVARVPPVQQQAAAFPIPAWTPPNGSRFPAGPPGNFSAPSAGGCYLGSRDGDRLHACKRPIVM